ncbi:MAG: hypothetical protein ABI037_08635 [Gemmatimonadales bacterium]
MTTFPPFAGIWTARAILVSLFLMAPDPPLLAAQDTSSTPVSLLRVLAEAADGARGGGPVYFVADRRFPHQVVGPFASPDAANAVRADSGAMFGVFGPYTSPPESGGNSRTRVEAIRITVMTPQGRQTLNIDPGKVDALFLSGAAADKFVIPYYARIYGPEYAQRLRDRLGAVGKIICHIRPSYMCTPRPNGALDIIRVMQPMEEGRTVPR